MTQDHLKLIRIQEQSRQKLEIEIDDFKIENSKQKKQIISLERERDRLAEEQLDLTSRIDNLMYEIGMKKVINENQILVLLVFCACKLYILE